MTSKSIVLATVLGLMATNALADQSEQDLIIRFKSPQNHSSAGLQKALRRARNAKLRKEPEIQIVNSEEGLVRMRLNDRDDAASVLKLLSQAEEIQSVAPNLLYRPQINLRMRELLEEESADGFLSMPFLKSNPIGSSIIPGVDLPPTNVTTGADPIAAKDWALQKINMPSVEALGLHASTKTNIITAVIDTGIDYNHEDLSEALWRSPQNPTVIGYDFAHDTAQPYDNVHFDMAGCLKSKLCKSGQNDSQFLVNPGHGTHCAGHVGAVANNSIGIRGVGAGTQIMGLKFFYDFGEVNAGHGDDAASIKAIDFAIKNGVKVISASWGGREPRARGENSEMKAALVRAQQAGVIFVVAAGNDPIDQDKDANPSYPAAYTLDNMIVVAASDENDQLANFSAYGANSVHIAAPGVKILSTVAGGNYSDIVAKFKGPKGKMVEMDWDGTSMATPIVAGAVALVWAKYPELPYNKIRDKILLSARRVPGLNGKVSSGGVLDVTAALQ